jgi:pyruvate-formate lyase-activating enzyme
MNNKPILISITCILLAIFILGCKVKCDYDYNYKQEHDPHIQFIKQQEKRNELMKEKVEEMDKEILRREKFLK